MLDTKRRARHAADAEKALSLDVPPALSGRADGVIE
jgi:hypothetical protein